MKRSSLVMFCATAVLLLMAHAAMAADLTGSWVAETTGPDGQTRKTTFALKEDGGKLTGYMSTPQGDTAITEGTVSGDTITFAVIRDFGGEDRKMEYTGKATGDGLLIQMPNFGGPGRPGGAGGAGGRGRGGPRELLAKRVSTEAPKPLPPPKPKIALPPPTEAVAYNGLAKTPPMGWNSWNKFQRQVTDKVVREIAAAMATNGMKEAGYVYVNIDDTWEGTRDAQGNIQSNEKFPDMKALADYVHSKGLKLGIYSSPGPKTCAGFEGSYQHEQQDANTFAAWGIDYLKYDWCSASQVFQNSSMPAVYAKMGQALLEAGKKTGRPIVYSLCQYGRLNVGEWGAKAGGNLWRTTGDIRDSWASMEDLGFEKQAGLEKYSGPGHWNDPDMLEIGNGAMSDTEYRTHMSLWSLLASPLLAGNDLRDVKPAILEILTNKEVIAVDQDALGTQATRVAKNGDLEVWMRPLADGGKALGLFNRGEEPTQVTANLADLGVSGPVSVRDLWAHADKGSVRGTYSAEVPGHGVVLVKIVAR